MLLLGKEILQTNAVIAGKMRSELNSVMCSSFPRVMRCGIVTSL